MKISQLPVGTTPTGAELVPAVQGGSTVSLTAAQIASAGYAAGVAAFLITPTSANLLAAITNETGTGALVFGTSPTFTTQITVPKINGGSGTYSAAGNYTGGIASASFDATRGSSAAPITDSCATAVFQSWSNISAGSGTTVYSSWVKKFTGAFGGRAVWGEAFDTVGGTGSYVEGARFAATLNGGTLGNGVGILGLGIATVAYSYVGGAELQVFNLSGTPATTTFSSAKFSWGVMASCGQGAGAACDAGFITNPFSNAPFISGVLIAAGSVSDTAFRCDATLVYGIDLSRGTYSGAAINTPSVTTIPTTVGALPAAAGNKGARMFVTDSNAASFTAGIGAIVAAGGAVNVPVVSDGTNWRIG